MARNTMAHTKTQRTAQSILIAVLLLFTATGCSVNPATGKSQLILVQSSELEAMGAEAAPVLVKEYGGQVPERELRRYVATIGSRLAERVEPEYEEIEWQFITLDSDVINAFALPGGRVFISRGLLERLSSEAEVAAVLGHEIGHVTGRHVDERVSQATAVELGLAGLGQVTESQIASVAGQLFGQGYILKFGRDQELEADRLGLRYMKESGYDPRAMLGVVKVLMESSEGGRPPEFLSTHPNPERRYEQVQKLLATDEFKPSAGDRLGRYEERFQREAGPYLRRARR